MGQDKLSVNLLTRASPVSPCLRYLCHGASSKKLMKALSQYNKALDFRIELKETRLKRVAKMIESLPTGRMLDVGCADGTWANYWSKRGWQIFGVDLNEKNAVQASERSVRAVVVDLAQSSLPFAGNSFDLIFAGEIVEHLIDTDGFMRECHRCLRVEGMLIITTPNLVSLENRIRMFFGFYPHWVDFKLRGSGHVRAYTPRALQGQLKENGFTVKKVSGNWVPFVPQNILHDIQLPILGVTGLLFPSLAQTIIILAQRNDCA